MNVTISDVSNNGTDEMIEGTSNKQVKMPAACAIEMIGTKTKKGGEDVWLCCFYVWARYGRCPGSSKAHTNVHGEERGLRVCGRLSDTNGWETDEWGVISKQEREKNLASGRMGQSA